MVANATAAMTPKSHSPPTAEARWTTAMLTPPRTPPAPSWNCATPLTNATVAGAMTRKITASTEAMMAVPMATDLRAAVASRTVKTRTSRCGSPIVPSASPATSDTVENRSSFWPCSAKSCTPDSCAPAARA